jgi:hypothetical protein
VGIVENVFLGGQIRGKGFTHRKLTLLSQNLSLLKHMTIAHAAATISSTSHRARELYWIGHFRAENGSKPTW